MKRQPTVHGPGGRRLAGRKVTCSSSSSNETAQGSVLPSAVTISTSLTASSAAFSTISLTGSCTRTSTDKVPEKEADATLGSISMR